MSWLRESCSSVSLQSMSFFGGDICIMQNDSVRESSSSIFSCCLAAGRPYSPYNVPLLVCLRYSTGLTTLFLILVRAMLANI